MRLPELTSSPLAQLYQPNPYRGPNRSGLCAPDWSAGRSAGGVWRAALRNTDRVRRLSRGGVRRLQVRAPRRSRHDPPGPVRESGPIHGGTILMERRTFLSCLGPGLGADRGQRGSADPHAGERGRCVGGRRRHVARARSRPHLPGHVHARIDRAAEAETGPVGLNRTFSTWRNAGEDSQIRSDHANGRLPWISFTPPSSSSGMWSLIASGNHDGDIRARAR